MACVAEVIAEDTGQVLTSLRVDGGLTQSEALMQTQADLLGVPVEVFDSQDATALGVAALASVGAGGAADLPDALPERRPGRVYEPAERDARRQERLAVYRAGLAQVTARDPLDPDSGGARQ